MTGFSRGDKNVFNLSISVFIVVHCMVNVAANKKGMFISKCAHGMQPTTIYFEYNNILIIIMSCWLAVTCWC